jgi:DNA-directed RNA polymerase specialized sigma24 family protein
MRNVISIDSYRNRQPHDPRADPEHGLIERESAAALAAVFHQLLADLGPIDRRLVERFYIAGHQPAAIAAAYGFTPAGFRRRMTRIRGKLKAAYEQLNRLAPEGPPYKDAA